MRAGKLFSVAIVGVVAASLLMLLVSCAKPDHRTGYVAPSQIPTPNVSGTFLGYNGTGEVWSVPSNNLPIPSVAGTYLGFDGGTEGWATPSSSFPSGTGATVQTAGVPAVASCVSQIPLVGNGVSSAPSCQALPLSGPGISGILQYGNGGTGGMTAHGTVLAESSGSGVATPCSSGVAHVGNGSSADPSCQTLPAVGGGTGVSSGAAHRVAVFEGASPMAAVSMGQYSLLVGTAGDPAPTSNLQWNDSSEQWIITNGGQIYPNAGYGLEGKSADNVVYTILPGASGTWTTQHQSHYSWMSGWTTTATNQNVLFYSIPAPTGAAAIAGTIRVTGRMSTVNLGPVGSLVYFSAVWDGSSWTSYIAPNIDLVIPQGGSNGPGTVSFSFPGSTLGLNYSGGSAASLPIIWQARVEWDVD